jgi:hypothetical protein
VACNQTAKNAEQQHKIGFQKTFLTTSIRVEKMSSRTRRAQRA